MHVCLVWRHHTTVTREMASVTSSAYELVLSFIYTCRPRGDITTVTHECNVFRTNYVCHLYEWLMTRDSWLMTHVPGSYTSASWRHHDRYSGNGECNVFRLRPRPRCHRWVPSKVHMCAITHSCMWHNLIISGTWGIYMCDMTHSHDFVRALPPLGSL